MSGPWGERPPGGALVLRRQAGDAVRLNDSWISGIGQREKRRIWRSGTCGGTLRAMAAMYSETIGILFIAVTHFGISLALGQTAPGQGSTRSRLTTGPSPRTETSGGQRISQLPVYADRHGNTGQRKMGNLTSPPQKNEPEA